MGPSAAPPAELLLKSLHPTAASVQGQACTPLPHLRSGAWKQPEGECNHISFMRSHVAACDKRYECDHFLFHLWRLVVHWLHSDVKADPSDCFTSMVGYRENKLDLLGVRADVRDWRHVGYFHEVYCMLQTGRNQSL